jgi:hypothetical protein
MPPSLTLVRDNIDNQLNDSLEGLYNKKYDRRPIERFMENKTDLRERERIVRDLMSNLQDKDKYRHEMRDWAIKMSQLAEYHAHEFNRYRRAKAFWQGLGQNIRRYNTVAFVGAVAGMAIFASPLCFSLLLGNIGVAKLVLPYLDMRLGLTVNRRNYANELSAKMNSEAQRIVEMNEKRQTLTDTTRKVLQDLEVQYNILGESVYGKFKPEGWKPNKNFLIDGITEKLMDEQSGLINQALAAQ